MDLLLKLVGNLIGGLIGLFMVMALSVGRLIPKETTPKKPNFLLGCTGCLSIPLGITVLVVAAIWFSGTSRWVWVGLAPVITIGGIWVLGTQFHRMVGFQLGREKLFWEWFLVNEERLRSVELQCGGVVAIHQEISLELAKASAIFQVELGIKPPGSLAKPELIVSAGGNSRYFSHVDELLLGVPARLLETWDIVALKPRKPGLTKFALNGQIYDIAEVWFTLGQPGEEGRLPVTLYMDGDAEGSARQATNVFLEGVLGERDSALGLGPITILPVEQKPEGALPLAELAAQFDAKWVRTEAPK